MNDPKPPPTITPPAPATAPAAPKPAAAPIAVPVDDLKTLIGLIQRGKTRDVLDALKPRSEAQLSDLETLLNTNAAKASDRRHRFTLRRAIRFSRAERKGLTGPQTPGAFRATGGAAPTEKPGQSKSKPKTEAKVAGGKVQVRTGVSVKYGSGFADGRDDGFTITFSGADASRMHWLMFASRQVTLVYPAGAGGPGFSMPLRNTLTHNTNRRSFQLTTNPSRRRWTVDGGSKDSAFYEANTTVRRGSTELMLADPPSPQVDGLRAAFQATSPPTKAESVFYAEAYLVRDMDVLCRVDIELKWDIAKDASDPDGFGDGVQVKKAGEVKDGIRQLSGDHRACLASQLPEFDYFPGDPIPAPRHEDPFDPVAARAADDDEIVQWDLLKLTNPERCKAVARVAQANILLDVGAANFVTEIQDVDKTVTGLNYLSTRNSFPEESGDTVFLDHQGKNKGPFMPVERSGKLPTVAITMTPSGFKLGSHLRSRELSLGVMRHEMMHASHYRLAIDWLVKWRDELTTLSFHDWLREVKKPANGSVISEKDFNILIATRPPPPAFDRTATEALSWAEDFVTTLQFTLDPPDWPNIHPQEKWPAAINALRGLVKFFNLVLGQPEVPEAVKARIKQIVCVYMTDAGRATLLEWLDWLINPRSKLPPSPTKQQEDGITLLEASFRDKQPLRIIQAIVKSCPRGP